MDIKVNELFMLKLKAAELKAQLWSAKRECDLIGLRWLDDEILEVNAQIKVLKYQLNSKPK